jgi:hypothetical protein
VSRAARPGCVARVPPVSGLPVQRRRRGGRTPPALWGPAGRWELAALEGVAQPAADWSLRRSRTAGRVDPASVVLSFRPCVVAARPCVVAARRIWRCDRVALVGADQSPDAGSSHPDRNRVQLAGPRRPCRLLPPVGCGRAEATESREGGPGPAATNRQQGSHPSGACCRGYGQIRRALRSWPLPCVVLCAWAVAHAGRVLSDMGHRTHYKLPLEMQL